MKAGNGPGIVVKDLLAASGQYDKNLNVITLDSDLANDPNLLRLGQASAFKFYLTAIILHEFVHFGNGLTSKYPNDS